MKPKVLISTGKMNIPEDVSDVLKDYAEVEYVSRPYTEKLDENVVAVLVGTEPVNAEYLDKAPNVTCPTLVVHGTHDRVIPYRMGTEIYSALKAEKQMATVRGAGHNDS